MEEEFIVNKLMKRLDQLKKEKQVLANEVSISTKVYACKPVSDAEDSLLNPALGTWANKLLLTSLLVLQVEQEEEYLVNNLQRRLTKVRHT